MNSIKEKGGKNNFNSEFRIQNSELILNKNRISYRIQKITLYC